MRRASPEGTAAMGGNILVRLEIRHEKLKEEFVQILASVGGFEVQRYSDDQHIGQPRPHGPVERAFELVERSR